MNLKEEFVKREPIFANKASEILADEEIIKKQSCPNWRCRGNVDYHCVYHKRQYDICGDKGSADSDF